MSQALQNRTNPEGYQRQADNPGLGFHCAAAGTHDENGQDQVRRKDRHMLKSADQTDQRRRLFLDAIEEVAWSRHRPPCNRLQPKPLERHIALATASSRVAQMVNRSRNRPSSNRRRTSAETPHKTSFALASSARFCATSRARNPALPM